MPADFEGNGFIQQALMKRLGVKDHEGLLQALQVDMRRIPAPYGGQGPDALGYYTSIWGVKERARDPGDGRPVILPVFNEHTTLDQVHAHPWPDPAAVDFSGIRAACEAYRGQYALYGAPWVPFFHEGPRMIGQEICAILP
jgi:hypothetical protein